MFNSTKREMMEMSSNNPLTLAVDAINRYYGFLEGKFTAIHEARQNADGNEAFEWEKMRIERMQADLLKQAKNATVSAVSFLGKHDHGSVSTEDVCVIERFINYSL